MGTVTLLALLLLFAAGKGRGPSATPAAQAAARAQRDAAHAAAKASKTNNPADHQRAAQAAHKAAVLTNHAASQATAAKDVPIPWPAAVPKDLPSWPSGWKPAQPPSPAVVARAWQLLAPLWKKGQGSKAVEQTAGRWTTYVAQYTSPGVKGVTAWLPKNEPARPQRDQPVSNV